jgi:uncharacterized protein YtpQ (UPF0354 family)
MTTRRDLLQVIGSAAGLALAGPRARAGESKDPYPRTREYIVALVRSYPGADPKSRPVQKIEPVTLQLPPKSSPDSAPIIDHFVGDLRLYYVFDDPQFTIVVHAKDLKRLGITRQELPALVVSNFRRLYPKLRVYHPDPGLGVLTEGGTLEPCILLDGVFWEHQQRTINKEVIAIVPSRDEVIFTTREPKQNIELLKHLAVQRYEAAGKRAVSRTVFAWRFYKWEVLA